MRFRIWGRIKKNGMIFVLLIGLSACATRPTIPDDPVPNAFSKMETAECEKTSKKSVYTGGTEWNACTRDAAGLAYTYAQMATNVYTAQDGTPFDLGPDLRALEPLSVSESGLEYRVFERVQNGTRSEIIIAYRGTNFGSWQDWIYGNIGTRQRKEALAAFDRVVEKYGMKPSVTGHSLGGALATQVSLCRDVYYNIVFDASPRFSKKLCDEDFDNHNVSIVEYGEVNKYLRIFGREPTQRYVSLNCLDKGGAISQHSMGKLAACLTTIAAIDDGDAARSQQLNGISGNPNLW